MRLTLDALINGRGEEIPAHFVAARERWASLLAGLDANGIMDLADGLAHEQHYFERECGGRVLGKEAMAIAGIAYLIDQGEEVLAAALGRALYASMCSVEVKSAAEQTAGVYELEIGRWGEQ